jgi:L-ascorbate metabolism protein UlaG (beta-lactamase superfamily)
MPTLRFIGHSAFLLEGDGQTIAIDPFISGNPVATIAADDVSPTTILLTHGHADHVGDAVALSKRTGAPIYAIVELAGWLGKQGVQAVGFNHGGTAQFDGGSVKLVPAWHTTNLHEGVYIGQPAGMVVRFGGKTIYFAGDTCLFLDMQLIGDEGLDLAVIPIGDFYTMGPADALRAVKFLRPRTVVPCHYNTFPPIAQDAEAFKTQVEEQTDAKVQVMKPGDRWEIT